MPRRASVYLTTASVEQKMLPPDSGTEPTTAHYSVKPAWIDAAGRTCTWAMYDPHGTKMAEITTKRAARRLADLLDRVMSSERMQ